MTTKTKAMALTLVAAARHRRWQRSGGGGGSSNGGSVAAAVAAQRRRQQHGGQQGGSTAAAAELLQRRVAAAVAAAAALISLLGGGGFLWRLHDQREMWKKVNLAVPQNLAAVAARPTPPDSGGKVKKGKKFSVQQFGVAKSRLREKKSLKKVKKGKKQITATTHSGSHKYLIFAIEVEGIQGVSPLNLYLGGWLPKIS